MVPTPLNLHSRKSGLLYSVASLIAHNVPKVISHLFNHGTTDATLNTHTIVKRQSKPHDTEFIVFAVLIPVLVLMSGLFAGLTLGYMSLDETQLHVLSVSGTPKQKEYAKKIQPIRKNGHLLLVTLLLANMITNETLPVISAPVLGGGVQSVVVSTVLIVIFSEIIPQSLCTRYGLAIGANMAWLVRILIFTLGIVSWPVAKLLEFVLGSHHGIMYRRSELKELIAMHAATGELGGDLNRDTITIIGATLDLQEKVVKQAMTPIEKVFMLNITSKLDYETMRSIADTGHSRVPVYEEVEVPIVSSDLGKGGDAKGNPLKAQKVIKIIGILLVKQCLMLDPKDATPVTQLKLNRVICVPNNMSLLYILDRFQEGRSHMAVISRFGEEKAASIKHQVKKGLTQRLLERVGMADSSDSDSDSDTDDEAEGQEGGGSASGSLKRNWRKSFRQKRKNPSTDAEQGEVVNGTIQGERAAGPEESELEMPRSTWEKLMGRGREQNMPDDAVLAKEEAKEFLQSFDPACAPLGIITMEDVLEELIGEEIYDEFDSEGQSHLRSYISPKYRGPRPRPTAAEKSPVAPSEGTTAISATDDATTKSHSAPNSPNLSANQDDTPISRQSSLGQSLSALAMHRIKRNNTTTPAGAKTPRERSRVRKESRDSEGPGNTILPAVGISDVPEEDALRIPDAQEKTGPDISKSVGEEKEE
ncbi:hypothetical protein EW026_g1787 [Hermanssonia centrifuga]|uniref:CNNM transmembrane domain-containing protein n=1 Tax=Hermanssonia centrifuga TaxID=98765 RepID=A0A4S4KQC1_9APHY|nr:hypothetical protein EW026_g1787 [Hermanssonia centrifuga]